MSTPLTPPDDFDEPSDGVPVEPTIVPDTVFTGSEFHDPDAEPDLPPFESFLQDSGLLPADVPHWSYLQSGVAVQRRLGLDRPAHGGGVLIPYLNYFGEPVLDQGTPFARVRLLNPFDVAYAKYQSPGGSANHVYIPTLARSVFEEFKRRVKINVLLVVEGEKKAETACKFGLPAIGISGVYNWSEPREKEQKKLKPPKDLLSELVTVFKCFEPEIILVVFDSDGAEHEQKYFAKANVEKYKKLATRRYCLNLDVNHAGHEFIDTLLATQKIRSRLLFVPFKELVGAPRGEQKIAKRGLDDWLIDEQMAAGLGTYVCPPPVFSTLFSEIKAAQEISGDELQIAADARKRRIEEILATSAGGYIPLGKSGDETVIVWNLASQSLIARPGSKLTNAATIMSLCGADFTRNHEPWQTGDKEDGKAGIDIIAAAGDIIESCVSAGDFDRDTRVRGAGVWRDHENDNVLIINSSDGVWRIAPGEDPQSIPRCAVGQFHVYPSAAIAPVVLTAAQIDDQIPQPNDPQRDLIKLLTGWRWRRSIDAFLLLGWWCSTAYLGALEARPGCFVTGESASGKTTLFNRISDMMIKYRQHIEMGSDSSSPGIRQLLGKSAIPLILDELEPGNGNNHAARKRAEVVEGLFRMLRASFSASGGDRHGVVKGSATGEAQDYSIRTAALVGGVNVAQLEQADRNRMLVLELLPFDSKKTLPPALSPAETAMAGDVLRNMMWRYWPHFLRNLPRVLERMRGGLGKVDGRVPVTYSIPCLCASLYWAGLSRVSDDDGIDAIIDQMIGRILPDLSEHFNRVGDGGGTDQQLALESLLSTSINAEHMAVKDGDVRIVRETVPINEAIDRAVVELEKNHYAASIPDESTRPFLKALKLSGLVLRVDPTTKVKYLFIAHTHPGMKKIENNLGLTGLGRLVARLPQVEFPPGISDNRASFGSGLKTMRGTWLRLTE